ncbi:MAG: tRNA lysidine(34) synthetase TilS, partial [Oscillospiraceae bacterium]|nr:tRNA lysidine(34) synthetase TilS [Oscillospiraceae bacterium]
MTVFSSGVLSAIREFDMIQPGDRVLVCLSGGADSVCLLSVLSELSDELDLELFAAHYNHRLRGDESDGDEEFCAALCRGLGVPLFVGSGDVRLEAERRSQGIEECARDMRYEFFYETAASLGGAKIATAHNAEDNLETVLMRIARGTGLKGLCGIPPVRGEIIRPLLYVKRAEIETYLRVNGIPHREDSSN